VRRKIKRRKRIEEGKLKEKCLFILRTKKIKIKAKEVVRGARGKRVIL